MLLFGFWLAYYFRFELSFNWFYQPEALPTNFYRQVTILLAPVWLIVLALFGLYDFKNLFSGMREYARIFNASTLGMMFLILYIFFVEEDIARGWVVLSWVLVISSVLLGRFLFRRLVQHMRVRGRFLTAVLVVGANEEAKAIADQLRTNRKAGIWIAGVVDDGLGTGDGTVARYSHIGFC